MPPSSSRLRKLAGFTGVSAAALLGSAFFATSAFAHHPEVSATTDCTGVVEFTATAWSGDSPNPTIRDQQRTNPEIGISYQLDGGAFVDLPQEAAYHFDAANGYSFGDEIEGLTAGWDHITVRATALGEWGSGYSGPDHRETTIDAATGCTTPAQPSATVATPTCAEGGATVHLHNAGDDDAVFDVNGTSYTVDQDEDVLVTFPGDTPTDITVTSGAYTETFSDLEYHCAAPVPSATIADATCADTGTVVSLVNTGDAPADFTISVPGQPDVTVTVPANGTLDQPVALPEDATSTVTVVSGAVVDLSKDVTYDCTPDTPDTPSTPSTPPPDVPDVPTVPTIPELVTPTPPTPAVEVPVAAPATGEEVTPAPTTDTTLPTQVLGESVTAGAPAAAPSSATLPFTGSSTGPLALTGIGSLLAGLAMAFAGRRRTAQP
jgi:hypothetical protein